MVKWIIWNKKADFEQIGQRFGISPLLAKIIRNRDVVEECAIESFLHGSIKELGSPWLLKDMDKAVLLLKDKITQKKKIRIVGDYDIDGVCATFILKKSLDALGGVADTYIPDRIADGYGLNDDIIRRAKEDGVDTILTCDNGIAAKGQVELAAKLGMSVVITDHHEIPFEVDEMGRQVYLLPDADAVIDPKREDCGYPFSAICGAYVAYKLVEALYDKMRSCRPEGEQELLTAAAFATVGDVMELQGENRILVREGLRHLKNTNNPCFPALIQVTGLSDTVLSPYHVGFVLGPCINATGRLDMADRALRLLLTDDRVEAARLAGELKDLNESRKEMTAHGVEQGIACVQEQGLDADRILVVYLPDCHESLAGIIAGRLRERYGKPVFVLTDSPEGVKGSGRSISAYDMYANMTKIKDVFEKFGGHRMAAGLSLKKERIAEFRTRINEVCTLSDADMIEKLYIDAVMPIGYATGKLAEELALLEPFGNGNPRPLFAQKRVTLVGARILGKNANVLRLNLQDESGYRVQAVCFSKVGELLENLARDFGEGRVSRLLAGDGDIRVSIAYYPEINEYQNRRSLQLVITHFDWLG
ncbi:MAG: single-stranded-DNA-specific exonuclease RecJ [Lachnospiraceae bacterium]|nr:single-stranded-DNA-specific exonuclease RecJ [Lachnospiraceae bacterium]